MSKQVIVALSHAGSGMDEETVVVVVFPVPWCPKNPKISSGTKYR